MNAHFTTTEPTADAKVSVKDIDLKVTDRGAIKPRELVYCAPTDADPIPGLEGIHVVAEITANSFAATDRGRLVWQSLDTVTHHLPDYEMLGSGLFSAGLGDAKLIRLGRGLDALYPAERAAWAQVTAMRATLDADSPDAYSSSAEYDALLRRHNDIAATMGLLSFAALRCRAKTPAGHAARMAAHRFENAEGYAVDAAALDDLADEAARVADFVQPVVTGGATLDGLIAAHRAAFDHLERATDADNDAEEAFVEWRRKHEPVTPARIRDGRVVSLLAISGDPTKDVELICEDHRRWMADLCTGSLRSMAPAAATLVEDLVGASEAECLRRYHEETLPAMAEKRGPWEATRQVWQEACKAETAALDALLRYQPADLREVAALASYLSKEVDETLIDTGTLLRCLATIEA